MKKSHRTFVTFAANRSEINTSLGIKCEFLGRLAGDSKRRWKKTSAPDWLKEKCSIVLEREWGKGERLQFEQKKKSSAAGL